jgi:hypothetical protein
MLAELFLIFLAGGLSASVGWIIAIAAGWVRVVDRETTGDSER